MKILRIPKTYPLLVLSHRITRMERHRLQLSGRLWWQCLRRSRMGCGGCPHNWLQFKIHGYFIYWLLHATITHRSCIECLQKLFEEVSSFWNRVFATVLLCANSISFCRGVEEGRLAPDYKLIAHCQCRSTESPGRKLYEELQTWNHFYNIGEEEDNE